MSTGFALAAALFMFTAHSAIAQKSYPEKTVRLVTGYLAGGDSDFVTRTTAQKLGELMGTTVIVENRSGGGTNIAAEFVARAAPDGYTLFVGGSANTANMTPQALANHIKTDIARSAKIIQETNMKAD